MVVVIIALDLSEHSKYALDYYMKNIHREGNVVKVVHCPELWTNIGIMQGPTPGVVAELQKQANETTEALCKHCKDTFAACGVSGDFVLLKGESTWHQICDAAEKDKASMIVLGTRGQGTLKRTLMGSVSTSVLHHAPCPVLLCRHPKC